MCNADWSDGTATAMREVRARKPHHCDFWCGRPIEAGDTYSRWAYFAGSAYTVRVHRECMAIVRAHCGNDGFTVDGDTLDCAIEEATPDLDGLRRALGDMLTPTVERWWLVRWLRDREIDDAPDEIRDAAARHGLHVAGVPS